MACSLPFGLAASILMPVSATKSSMIAIIRPVGRNSDQIQLTFLLGGINETFRHRRHGQALGPSEHATLERHSVHFPN